MSHNKIKHAIGRSAILASISLGCLPLVPNTSIADDLDKQVYKLTDLPVVKENEFSEVQKASHNTENGVTPAASCGPVTCGPVACAPETCLIYAIEQTGPVANASPTGPVGISNIGEHLGYRVGFSLASSDCTSMNASYTRWDGATTSILDATGTNVLNSTVTHPSVDTTGAASLQAVARQSAGFQFADISLRRIYKANNVGVLNWNAGLRYGNLEQGLNANQTISVATGLTNVTTDIDFDGLGILGGLDGERFSTDTGLLVYGRAMGSLLGGNWKADYRQTNQFGGGVIANHYEDFRISPVIDTELGVGWQSCNGRLRVTTGYLFSTWFNAVTTRDYIQSVRTANLLNLDDNLTFSGLTLRTDLRF
jgi:Legionella pneumophila major outer membrane protein precursor